MVFSSTIFLFIFLPVAVIGYYLLAPRFRNYFLLLISLLFYAWGEPKFVFILMLSVVTNYAFALLVEKYRDKKNLARIVMLCMILFNVIIFFIFKYLTFVVSNINAHLGGNIVIPDIVLPIGISFFTFQAMSYVIDVYRGKGMAQKNPLNVGLYIALFPQLIAGPIVRYETIAAEIKERHENKKEFIDGVVRFSVGLSKKVILSNSLAVIADRYYGMGDYAQIPVAGAWLGAICYTLQIYFDFSGYSDMAIGLGLMFGFHFPENFNYPYISKSVSEFWRRWHITLSTWFRDYVYIPLGGNRVSRGRWVFNIFVVWLLTGVWHGASWNFIFWGLYYFVLLIFEKVTNLPGRIKSKFGKILYRIFTLICVNFGWVLFRAPGLKMAWAYIKSMLGCSGNSLLDLKTGFLLKDMVVVLVIAMIASTPVAKGIEKITSEKHGIRSLYEVIRGLFIIVTFIVSISYCINGTYNPFIYFNF